MLNSHGFSVESPFSRAQGRSQGTPKGVSNEIMASGVSPAGVKGAEHSCTCTLLLLFKKNKENEKLAKYGCFWAMGTPLRPTAKVPYLVVLCS